MAAWNDASFRQTTQLPFRLEGRRARALALPEHLEIRPQGEGRLPTLRGSLGRPPRHTLSLVLRVHSDSGIPLAQGFIDLQPGDRFFETAVALLAMEGYGHLARTARQDVERRVWSRCAYATGSVA